MSQKGDILQPLSKGSFPFYEELISYGCHSSYDIDNRGKENTEG